MRAADSASVIVDMCDYGSSGKKRCRTSRQTNNNEDPKVAKLFEKFSRLGYEQQSYLLSFAKGYILGPFGEISMEQNFRFIMELGMSKYSNALDSIDRVADELLEEKRSCN